MIEKPGSYTKSLLNWVLRWHKLTELHDPSKVDFLKLEYALNQ